MTPQMNTQLIELLVCPDCGEKLQLENNHLNCRAGKHQYEVKNGIPCLYPSQMDKKHLHEEESLASMMVREPENAKDALSAQQWQLSKKDFWDMVRQNVTGKQKTFINIGCGFDMHFTEFEEAGHAFVNFDLVYRMLAALQSKKQAKSCVAGDINCLPFKKAAFDYVISIDVIHHESDHVEKLIEVFASLLKPGGMLFLEDPNAWGMFQAVKSIFMPRCLYRNLRSVYHKVKQSTHHPADYEFPTDVQKIKRILINKGFTDIQVYPQNAYPTIGVAAYSVYRLFSWIPFVKTYMNYHYMLKAVKKA